MAEERWVDLPNWEGFYEISSRGRVRSLPRTVHFPDGRRSYVRPGRRQLGWRNWAGYTRVVLVAPGKAKREAFLHELVLEAFAGPCPPGFISCHLDDDKQNNDISNLRWGTYSDNMHDRVHNGIHHAAARTHCPKCGDEYQHISETRRGCLRCRRTYKREWARKRYGYQPRVERAR